MKRMICLFALLVLLCGCDSGSGSLKKGMELRKQLLDSNGFTFDAVIQADFGTDVYCFSVSCRVDRAGELSFEVTAPDLISGIGGTFCASGGALTFRDVVLSFPTLADGEISPVSAPWIFANALSNGYMKGEGAVDGQTQLTIMDSFEEDALLLNVRLDDSASPVQCDIFWQGRNVVSMEVKNFRIL